MKYLIMILLMGCQVESSAPKTKPNYIFKQKVGDYSRVTKHKLQDGRICYVVEQLDGVGIDCMEGKWNI